MEPTSQILHTHPRVQAQLKVRKVGDAVSWLLTPLSLRVLREAVRTLVSRGSSEPDRPESELPALAPTCIRLTSSHTHSTLGKLRNLSASVSSSVKWCWG